MSESTRESWEEELNKCPDCGADVKISESIESLGDGVAFGSIECEDNCGFSAMETWEHNETVKRD